MMTARRRPDRAPPCRRRRALVIRASSGPPLPTPFPRPQLSRAPLSDKELLAGSQIENDAFFPTVRARRGCRLGPVPSQWPVAARPSLYSCGRAMPHISTCESAADAGPIMQSPAPVSRGTSPTGPRRRTKWRDGTCCDPLVMRSTPSSGIHGEAEMPCALPPKTR